MATFRDAVTDDRPDLWHGWRDDAIEAAGAGGGTGIREVHDGVGGGGVVHEFLP